MGFIVICLVVLVVLLVRAVRIHKQLLADLEERGLSSVQARGEVQDAVSRPRAVLRRNTILPFNAKSGWDTLNSVDTFGSIETPGTVAHYVPPKPTDDAKRASHLSWPSSAKRMSGHNIHMKKVKGSRLSTVVEDPKPSSLVPVLNSSHLNASRPSLSASRKQEGRSTSSQSLLQCHPAFRNSVQAQEIEDKGVPRADISFFRSEANNRLQQVKSVAAVPSAEAMRPQLRARSASFQRRSQLKHMPSKQSVSSFGSADTSILASRMSPVIAQSTKTRPQKITKPRTKGPSIRRPRPFGDTFDLRAQVLGARHNANGSTPRTSVASMDIQEPCIEGKSTLSEGSSSQSLGTVDQAQSVTMSKVSSPTASPLAVRNISTPKRKLKMQVQNGVVRSPKRQHSQTYSRSSGGNPFQWDPAPLSSAAKPSALERSPSARQGHRRKNSVRISLVPTFHGPSSRTPSPSMVVDKKDDTTAGAATIKPTTGLGLGFSSTRSLPTPPSSSTFVPELKFSTTSLRTSLTSTSPTLPLVSYDQSHVVFPTNLFLRQLSLREQKRLSNGSIFSLSKFPVTPSVIEPSEFDMSCPTSHSPAEPYNFSENFRMPETPYIPQHPFRPSTSEHDRSPSQSSLIDIDEYNPERPSLVFQTPTNVPSRSWQSSFATIPEESSVTSQRTLDVECSRNDDSPPVSPKTFAPPKFMLADRSAYNLPVYATAIPEETPDTIDPAILSKDSFAILNSSMSHLNGSIMKRCNSSRSSLAIVIPANDASAQSMFEPFLAAAFPSSPPTANLTESPVLGHLQSEASSLYSLPSPSPFLSPTSSPIQLPRLPPRPLRTSIAALRRMNSDAADAKKEKSGRGERRYLCLGREYSVQLPGDESWLDDIEDDINIEFDGGEGKHLIGDSTMKPGKLSSGASAPAGQDTSNATHGTDSEKRPSNIWEDGEKFWTSTPPPPPPPPPGSPNKPHNRYQPLASSPLASPALSISTSTTKASKKRDFQVAKDISPPENSCRDAERKKRQEREVDGRRSSRHRKRSVLGNGTPNVRIQVTSLGGQVVMGTPGSLYDAQGFLRF
ncbi:hypothetical protein CC86DRAFT_394092 [Ophiobolus disseminans]|uniref:Uncharacterized protein n=1 Tax=Ophiobolus disseminans TaxID=1469910 RepID=A0A6A7A2I0_9PLEO|nr:hypothetical protein CC86DRAFT_394092 [Ophiobolus disseminans]